MEAKISPTKNPKDRLVDFKIHDIPFDHKTTVFPKQFQKSIHYAKTHEEELITWLYDNQSTQQRHHLKNRLFIVVFDKANRLTGKVTYRREVSDKLVFLGVEWISKNERLRSDIVNHLQLQAQLKKAKKTNA